MTENTRAPTGAIDWYDYRLSTGGTDLVITENGRYIIHETGSFSDVVGAYIRIRHKINPETEQEWAFERALRKNTSIIELLNELETSEPALFAGLTQIRHKDNPSENMQAVQKLLESMSLDRIGHFLMKRGSEPDLTVYVMDYLALFRRGLE